VLITGCDSGNTQPSVSELGRRSGACGDFYNSYHPGNGDAATYAIKEFGPDLR